MPNQNHRPRWLRALLGVVAVLSADAVADDNLHLGSPDGPRLALLTLPYELDRDREIQR